MKKTCFNCVHFCNTLCDREHPQYHIHYWCKQWNALIDGLALADRYEYDGIYYDDLETGDACCYMFEPMEVPTYEDEWFDRHKAHNLENRMTDVD